MTKGALLCDISSCDDVQIDTNLVIIAFSARNGEKELVICTVEDSVPTVMLFLLI